VPDRQRRRAREQIRALLSRLNFNLWLSFGEASQGKRKVRVLKGGIITTGEAEFPVRPYGGTADRPGEDGAVGDSASLTAGVTQTPSASLESSREGVSFTMCSRGDTIRTCDLLDPNQAL
jgi:hypothetical protein